jgi:hypothetical protein
MTTAATTPHALSEATPGDKRSASTRGAPTPPTRSSPSLTPSSCDPTPTAASERASTPPPRRSRPPACGARAGPPPQREYTLPVIRELPDAPDSAAGAQDIW